MRITIVELIQQGGMVHYTSQLSNALSNQDTLDIQVILPKGTDVSLFNKKIEIKEVSTIGRHPYRMDMLLMHILKFKPDIVHITIRHPLILPLLPILHAMKIPIFLTIHDVIPHIGERKFVAEFSTKISIHFSRILFVHGEKLKANLATQGVPEKKISVIPHGDYSFFTGLITNNNYTTEISTILFFGRILDYKGLKYLIQAEPDISKNIPDLKIIIAGDGDFSKYQKMIINRDRFEIINRFIADKEVSVLFSRASIIVLPYIEASQTGIIPIAYAFAKPVVTTNVGSIPEIVKDGITGIIVPPCDVKALSEAIITLLKNWNLTEMMGIAGQNFMKKRLGWDMIADRLIDLYQRNRA